MATYITPADPIQWSSSTAYDELVLVTDESGKGYVSKKQVPQGTQLTDTEHWVPIVNLSEAVAGASSAASAAQQAANNAQSAAQTAQSTASTAQQAAQTAQQAAETAQSAADDAQSAAENAQSTASTSLQGVLAAQYIALMQQGSYPIQ